MVQARCAASCWPCFEGCVGSPGGGGGGADALHGASMVRRDWLFGVRKVLFTGEGIFIDLRILFLEYCILRVGTQWSAGDGEVEYQ